MDGLQRDVAALVERAAADGEAPHETIARVHDLAAQAAGISARAPRGVAAARSVAHLSEPWFC
jgi:hypothetical protein